MAKLDKLPYQKVLFDGPWGIGKTKHILDSIIGKENTYYISLFGKKDINTFYQELYYLLLSESEVKVRKVLKHLNKINFSKFGLSMSIPLMSDILANIQKQLKGKSDITIIVDDLERKSDSLEIKEVFGFVDSIAKNKDIKVVLVASSGNFSDKEKRMFEDYLEKSVDRKYKITAYSEEAPQLIMGEEVWLAIKKLTQNFELKNLRTLEKVDLFIREVIQEIPENYFNNKVTKSDLYKICFSVVVFVVNHNKKMILLPDDTSENTKILYEPYRSEEKFPEYIWHYILERKLENSMMQSFIPLILDWFETGDSAPSKFEEVYNQVNTYKETVYPLFMSDKEIVEEINEFSNFIHTIDENISIKNFMQRLDELATIAEKTNLDFNYTVDEVVDWLINNTDSSNYYNNTYLDILPRRESVFINDVIEKLKKKSIISYSGLIISKMSENINKHSFTDNELNTVRDFKIFYDKLRNNKEIVLKEKLVHEMKNNNWFLPLPLGKITDSHWSYCHAIFRCIEHIGYEEGNTLIKEANIYFEEKIENSTDEIFKYRIKSLVGQYLKNDK